MCFQLCQYTLVSHFRPQLSYEAHNPALMVSMENDRKYRPSGESECTERNLLIREDNPQSVSWWLAKLRMNGAGGRKWRLSLPHAPFVWNGGRGAWLICFIISFPLRWKCSGLNSDMFQKHKRTGWIVTLTQHEFTLSFQTEVLESDAEFLLPEIHLWASGEWRQRQTPVPLGQQRRWGRAGNTNRVIWNCEKPRVSHPWASKFCFIQALPGVFLPILFQKKSNGALSHCCISYFLFYQTLLSFVCAMKKSLRLTMYVMVGCRSKTVPGEIYISGKEQRASVCIFHLRFYLLNLVLGFLFSLTGFLFVIFFYWLGYGEGSRKEEEWDIWCPMLNLGIVFFFLLWRCQKKALKSLLWIPEMSSLKNVLLVVFLQTPTLTLEWLEFAIWVLQHWNERALVIAKWVRWQWGKSFHPRRPREWASWATLSQGHVGHEGSVAQLQ